MSQRYRGFFLRIEGPLDQTSVLQITTDGCLGDCIGIYASPLYAMDAIDQSFGEAPRATGAPLSDDADVSYRVVG